MGAFLGPLIGLGVSGLSSLFGGTPQPKQVQMPTGGAGMLPAASSGLGASSDYFKTILGGSQEATQSLLGPDVNTILSQYDNAAKTATELGPRGGGRNAALAAAPFQKATAYGKLLAAAKPQAASGLADVAGKEGQIGSSLYSTQQNAQTEANSLAFKQNQAQAASYGSLGNALGGLFGGLFKKKSAGGSDSSGPLDRSLTW